jgi:hypothetical protein
VPKMVPDQPPEQTTKRAGANSGGAPRRAGGLGSRKRFWLLPFILVPVLLLAAVLLAKGPAIVPFIYRSF